VPIDFTGGPQASVDLGDGGAHSPQIRFTADDISCRWNGFPVCIDAGLLDTGTPSTTVESRQIASFVTSPGLGCFGPNLVTQWPPVYVYDYLKGLLAGYRLQGRARFFATGGGTSVGSFAFTGDGVNCGAVPGPILGAFDSGFVDLFCFDCTIATGPYLSMSLCFTNFSPLGGVVQIDNGILDVQWVPHSAPLATYEPFQDFEIAWHPPCDPLSTDAINPGLYIALETDSCGVLTKTYQNIADEVNALDLGITATILGGHGADIAKPDPSTSPPWYCADMTGAECSGATKPPPP
jgi:hypothetical protein